MLDFFFYSIYQNMKRDLEQMEISEGNTNPPKKRPVQCKKWCFTWNNYPVDGLEQMEQTFIKMGIHYIVGKEVGESGTPHLQGYIECPSKMRWSQFKLPDSIHWEKCKGTRLDNIKYCSKDGDYIHSALLKPPRELVTLSRDKLLTWQAEVVSWFDEYEDPLFGRTIHWIYEREGNVGKTVLASYLYDSGADVVVVGGRATDMQHGVAEMVSAGVMPKIVIVDIPRVSTNHFSIAGVESIKNGLFFSPKFDSKCCRYNRPWVLVCSNEPPPYEKMSSDRWKVFRIENDNLISESLGDSTTLEGSFRPPGTPVLEVSKGGDVQDPDLTCFNY